MTVSVASEDGNIVTFVANVQKILGKNANRDNLLSGDDSSDSEGDFEDLSNLNQAEEEENGDDESESKNLYCVSFRKKRGPLSDYLETYRAFREECFKLNNADQYSMATEEQSGA